MVSTVLYKLALCNAFIYPPCLFLESWQKAIAWRLEWEARTRIWRHSNEPYRDEISKLIYITLVNLHRLFTFTKWVTVHPKLSRRTVAFLEARSEYCCYEINARILCSRYNSFSKIFRNIVTLSAMFRWQKWDQIIVNGRLLVMMNYNLSHTVSIEDNKVLVIYSPLACCLTKSWQNNRIRKLRKNIKIDAKLCTPSLKGMFLFHCLYFLISWYCYND